jgi:hypothetical protein
MGFDRLPIVGGLVSGLVGGNKAKPAPAAASTPAASSTDAAKEEERRRLAARGVGALNNTSALGDTTQANLGRKALLGA